METERVVVDEFLPQDHPFVIACSEPLEKRAVRIRRKAVEIPNFKFPRNWEELCKSEATQAVNLLIDGLGSVNLCLFFATPSWVDATAIVRRRGVWGCNRVISEISLLKPGISAGVEILCDGRVRFAGSIVLSREAWPLACDYIRSSNAGLIVLFPSTQTIGPIETSAWIERIYGSLDGSKNLEVKWLEVLAGGSCGEIALLRTLGKFDDQSLLFELFQIER